MNQIIKKNQKLITYVKDNRFIFLSALCFTIILFPVKVINDDLWFFQNHPEVNSIYSAWTYSVERYFTWTSRQINGFINNIIRIYGKPLWVVYIFVSSFILLKALKKFTNKRNIFLVDLLCVTLFFLFPTDMYSTAGWVATTCSYFGPFAFGIMALVPIKKCLNGEKIKPLEEIFYIVCIIYAANMEQFCGILFLLYLTAIIFLLSQKKQNKYLWLNLFIIIISLVYILTCPGNALRKESEIKNWFPTFSMLDFIDKFDIGLSKTLQWMFAKSVIHIILISLILTFLIWKKYNNFLFRSLSLFPSLMILLLGPFKNLFSELFLRASFLRNDIDYYGEFTVRSNGVGIGKVQFGFYLFIACCLFLEIILLNETISDLLIDTVLMGAGIGSRVMMGFSPTVYASGHRTYASLIFCLTVLAAHLFANNIDYINNKEKIILQYAFTTLSTLGIINLICLVATAV